MFIFKDSIFFSYCYWRRFKKILLIEAKLSLMITLCDWKYWDAKIGLDVLLKYKKEIKILKIILLKNFNPPLRNEFIRMISP